MANFPKRSAFEGNNNNASSHCHHATLANLTTTKRPIIGRAISVQDRLYWIRLQPNNQTNLCVPYWPGVVYANYDELMNDVYCEHYRHKAQLFLACPKDIKIPVAYLFRFHSPVIQTLPIKDNTTMTSFLEIVDKLQEQNMILNYFNHYHKITTRSFKLLQLPFANVNNRNIKEEFNSTISSACDELAFEWKSTNKNLINNICYTDSGGDKQLQRTNIIEDQEANQVGRNDVETQSGNVNQ